MRALAILILSDGRPGHYHLAEGVASAIARRRRVTTTRLQITPRRALPGRAAAIALNLGLPPGLVLAAGYGLSARTLPAADLVISAGGHTRAANVAAARALGAANILCGTLRHLTPESFSLIVTSYARHAGLPRHLVALKPSGFDPDSLGGQRPQPPAPGTAPQIAGLLVGGNSGLFRYREAEWQRLAAFLDASQAQHGTRWIVSTSRRTPAAVADLLAAQAGRPGGPIAELIDFRTAGPGTLPGLFTRVQAVLCTEDSSTMLSEAVCAQLPVVGVAPAEHAFKDEEREYRAFMAEQSWCRFLPLERLEPDGFVAALSQVHPLTGNHLDRLADALADRLPQLFA